jgi:hypothetical protein
MNAPARQKDFVIETGIALPPPKRGRGSQPNPNSLSGVMRRMEIGESVFVSGRSVQRSSVGSRADRLKPKKFSVRTVEGGVRVWRVA